MKFYINEHEYLKYLKRTLELRESNSKIKLLHFEDDMKVDTFIDEENKLNSLLNNCTIVFDKDNDNNVNIGDTVDIKYVSEFDDMVEKIKLVGIISKDILSDNDSDVIPVSIDSTVGKILYRKKVGDICSYYPTDLNESESFIIKGKDVLNTFDTNEQHLTKKLTK